MLKLSHLYILKTATTGEFSENTELKSDYNISFSADNIWNFPDEESMW